MRIASTFARLSVTFLFLAGCEHVGQCPIYSIESIQVENQTNRTLNLSLCRAGHDPRSFQFASLPTPQPVPTQYNTNFEVNRFEDGRKPMQRDGGCGYVSGALQDKTNAVAVALTSTSFGTVKLCYVDGSKSHVQLVDPAVACPPATQEQTSPVDDCTTLN